MDDASPAAPRRIGPPQARGCLRSRPEDFDVTELLGFEPGDEGPHALVQVEKREATTLDVVEALARHARCRRRDVGYSGLKDRNAVTRQWLSLPFDESIDWASFATPRWRILEVRRNPRKLRIGSHRANAFAIVVRDLAGPTDALAARIARIGREGVPNYFGPQRFGQHGDNLRRARRWFVDGVKLGRRQRRFALSAARALLFNRVLAERLRRGTFDRPLDGEPVCLDGSRSFFDAASEKADALAERLATLDVHTSGPLWGAGPSPATGACAAFESEVAATLDWLADPLADAGLRQERRALRLSVRNLTHHLDGDTLTLHFELTRGAFATSVLHELLDIDGLHIPC